MATNVEFAFCRVRSRHEAAAALMPTIDGIETKAISSG
jgi:hypothetical protein